MNNIIKLRNDFEISDDEFEKVTADYNDDLDSWFLEHREIVEECTAFYIAKAIERNCLWKGNFSGVVNSALETLTSYFLEKNFDRNRFDKIFASKYGLVVVKDKPMKFQKIK